MWCIWVRLPSPTGKAAQDGWSRIATGMTQEQAEWMASVIFFPVQAMPEQVKP